MLKLFCVIPTSFHWRKKRESFPRKGTKVTIDNLTAYDPHKMCVIIIRWGC